MNSEEIEEINTLKYQIVDRFGDFKLRSKFIKFQQRHRLKKFLKVGLG
jgi:hypothetical protein